MTIFPASLLLASLLAAPAATPADDAQTGRLKRLSLEQLGQVEVTSVSKESEEVWKTAAAIFVLTHDDIIRSGATDIPDALRTVPGVEVARIDSGRNWVVGIRGFGDQFSRSMLVLIDGRSLYTPLFAGVHWSLQDMVLDDIDRIEIIRGPGGTVWGANAVNGVINIITRPASETQGLTAAATTGNVDQAIGSVRYGGTLGSTGSYRVYGKAFDRGPEWHSDNRDFDRWHMSQAGFRSDWTLSDRDKLTIHGDAYDGEIGESVLVGSFAPPGNTLIDAPAHVNGQNVVARWDRDLGSDENVMVQAYWDRTDRLGTDYGETRNTFDLDFVHQLHPAPRHTVLWGAGLRLEPATYTQTVDVDDFAPHNQPYNLYSGFLQDSVELPGRLTAAGGAKLEHNTYTGFELQPSASLLWRATPHQSAWAAVARAVRTPSRIDTDISVEELAVAAATPIYARILGSPDINAETLNSTEAGYRALLSTNAYVDVAVFDHRYSGLVTIGTPFSDIATRDGLTYQRVTLPFVNGVDGPSRGFEIAPSATLGSNLQIRGSYSYLSLDLDYRDGVPKSSFGQLLSDAPRHQVVGQALFHIRGVELSPVYRFVGNRPETGIPSYNEMDLPARWSLSPKLTLSLVGQNLLHAHHAEWARDPGPTVEIKRTLDFRIVWRP